MEEIVRCQQTIKDHVDEVVAVLKRRQLELLESRRVWEQQGTLVDISKTVVGRVKLDIGGTVVATSLSTLTSQPGFFSVMFSGKCDIAKDEDGCFFLDRNGCSAAELINFLRPDTQRELYFEGESERRALLVDAEFYEYSDLGVALGGNAPVDDVDVGACKIDVELSDNMLGQFHTLIEREQARLDREIVELAQEKETFYRLKAKVDRIHSKHKIKLDIGGRIFCTSIQTLKKRDSKLKSMFDDDINQESDGCHFIDRDYRAFHFVLDFLRNGSIDTSNMSEAQLGRLGADFDYYGLQESSSLFAGMKLPQKATAPMFAPKKPKPY